MTDVVATRAEAHGSAIPPLIVLDALAEQLAGLGIDPTGLRVGRIGEGQSNVTFAIDAGDRELVLRRGPRPPLPPTTHDMLREARVQRLLAELGFPVPHIVAVCDDPSVLGVPFYLMERVDGVVVTDALPHALAGREERTGLVDGAVDTLARLHAIDVSTGDLATLGRPDGYLSRQVDRFASLWPSVSQRVIPAVDTLAAWLADRVPATARASVVHGDYRIGNLMYARTAPARVAAVLDWEMATLGDPLADLGYLVATYAEPGSVWTPLELTTVTRGDGFPDRAAIVQRYVERTGVDVSALPWYQALALWKAAVFCEAIYTRFRAGERPGDAFGPGLERGVPVLLAEAARAAGIDVDAVPRETAHGRSGIA